MAAKKAAKKAPRKKAAKKQQEKELKLVDVFSEEDLRDMRWLYDKAQVFMKKDGTPDERQQMGDTRRFQIVARLGFVINDLLSLVDLEADDVDATRGF